jgi:hypothetical protein
VNRTPRDLILTVAACFYPPTTQTTSGAQPTTATSAAITTPLTTPTLSTVTTTTTLSPTTTTMNYCTETKGMNEPLPIQPGQVTSNPPSTSQGDINPTPNQPGLDFPTPNPQINVTLDQPSTLTVIYVPTNIPNEPTTVEQFTVQFVFPNGTTSPTFTSEIPSPTTTTTPSTGVATGTTTTPSATSIVPPSGGSPQVDLPPNFEVPENTTVVITVTSTTNDSPATGVCNNSFIYIFHAGSGSV